MSKFQRERNEGLCEWECDGSSVIRVCCSPQLRRPTLLRTFRHQFVFFPGDTVSSNFIVVDHHVFWNSDHPGIDLIVTSPGGNVVHSSKGTSQDKFEFMSPSNGMYKFCFHNSHSALETVSFYIHVGHIPSEHDLAKETFGPY
ncbi:hypothetical protein HYC85_012132 [Camellia sinensis]|uniref:GOLD domain-containing protein n=1 Tax=Camellia sinensis TaxID=4442 RepID=A0A7J7HBM9_CAMSI|nr:hypothetical protein HYC85_012132 [Camellia sinensis]